MKKNEIFEVILTTSCEANEQSKERVLSKFRNIDLVDTRAMAVAIMKKYGMNDIFIATMFGRTRQWVSFIKKLYDVRYSTCWNFRATYQEISNQIASKYPLNNH